MSNSDRVWKVLSNRALIAAVILVTELLIVTPLIAKGFIWNQLYYGDAVNRAAQSEAEKALQEKWRHAANLQPGVAVMEDVPHITAAPINTQEGGEIAKITIPQLGADWSFVILEGVSQATIARGPGHYPDTAGPGELGNFAIAGHRVGSGSPFDEVNRLKECSTVNIETSKYHLTYKVLGKGGQAPSCLPETVQNQLNTDAQYSNVNGVTVVTPNSYPVVWAIPEVSNDDSAATVPLLTITTCHPRYSDAQRLIIHAALTSIQRK